MPSSTVVRFMEPEEKEELKTWRKLDKEVDEFLFTWERWKKWEGEPPIVILYRGNLAGYHGVSFNKTRYANSASQFVLEQFRGKRLAGAMIDFLLKEAHRRGLERLRFRTPKSGEGYLCWRGFGVSPFGECEKDYWYDLCIENILCVEDLIDCDKPHLPVTDCNRRISLYKRSNVKPLVKEYERLIR